MQETDTFTIQLLQSFDFLIWSTSNATCLGINDGAIAIAHDEDNGPFTYNWSNGTNEKELDNVGPGNYSVEIIDVNGCSINSGDITIHADRIVEIEFDSISAVSCANFSDGYASIILDSSYASTLWNNGANGLTVDNISGGTYTILVTDSTNCQGIDSIEIAEPAPLNIEIVSNESVSCFGENDGYVEVTVSGGNEGYEFEWSNGSLDNNIDLLTAGFYDVSISDSKSCVDSLIGIEVWEPDSLVVSLLTKGDETCTGQNGFVDIEIEGGTEAYEFMWSNDSTSQNLEELEAGIYSVTVVDRNNCQAFIDDIGINRIEVIIEEEITNVNDVNCFGEKNGSFELNLENVTAYPMILYVNGDSIISENANLILDSLDGGEYAIEGEDANGCLMDMIAVTIDEPQELNILITEINTVSCGELGGEITIQVTGGTEPFDINWSSGQTGETIDSLDVGFYSVEIFDSKMCSDSIIDIEIGTSAPLVQETITINQPLCNGDMTGVIDLIYTGGLGNITYELNGDEFDNGLFETLGAGIYDVVISDSSLCNVDSLSFEIINPPVLTITLDSISPSYCGNTNGYIAVSAIGGTGELNYNWSGGISDTSSIVTNISEGLYDVVVLDENGCGVGLEDLEIENIDKVLDVENLFIDSTSCFNTSNGKIFYDLVGDYSFPIETTLNNEVFAYSNGFINNVPAGNYELVITDVVGCTYEINEVLIESPLPIEYEFEILVPIICLDDSTGVISMNAMGGTGELDYLWDNNDEGQTIDSLASGYYRCAIVDERNCVLFTDSIFLENPDTLIVNLVTIDATEGNNNGAIYVTTSGGVMPYEYNWNYDIPTDTDTIEFLGESSWNLNFVDGNGCMFDTSFVIKNIVGIEEVEFIEVKISPNPFHDYLQIRTELDDKEYSIVILSAQGELVRHIDPSALIDEKIFLGDLMAGIYFVVLKTENGVIVRKLVKR
jgi:hypothetical protein